jgi:hypothetical protein
MIGQNKGIRKILCADNKMLLADTDDDFQRSCKILTALVEFYNIKISTTKTKGMTSQVNGIRRMKIAVKREITERVETLVFYGR